MATRPVKIGRSAPLWALLLTAGAVVTGCSTTQVSSGPTPPAVRFPVYIHAPVGTLMHMTRTGHDAGPVSVTTTVTATTIVVTQSFREGSWATGYAVGKDGIRIRSQGYLSVDQAESEDCFPTEEPPAQFWNSNVSVGERYSYVLECTGTDRGLTFSAAELYTSAISGSAFVTIEGRPLAVIVVTGTVRTTTFGGSTTQQPAAKKTTATFTQYVDPGSGLVVRSVESVSPQGYQSDTTADSFP